MNIGNTTTDELRRLHNELLATLDDNGPVRSTAPFVALSCALLDDRAAVVGAILDALEASAPVFHEVPQLDTEYSLYNEDEDQWFVAVVATTGEALGTDLVWLTFDGELHEYHEPPDPRGWMVAHNPGHSTRDGGI